MEILVAKIPLIILILVRLSAFLATVPFFSYRTIPNQVKIGLAVLFSVIIALPMDAEMIEVDGNYALLIIKEALVGLTLGLLAYIVMSAVQIAGGFIDFQIGFAIANVIDPQTGTQSPLTGQFFNVIALLLLLSANGHHLLLDAIYYSYEFVPVAQTWPKLATENTVMFVIQMFAGMFIIAFQLAIPIVATVFLTDLALGIVAKTVPQLNIFVIGFPVKIFVAFVTMVVMFTVMSEVMQQLFKFMFVSMRQYMELIGIG
ncbi:flagellar biosynthesis protein FliR [Kurthia sp. 3B1D]|uniref:Flagellar biosynthetic protein FliR n=2 Tax=Kurthia TaxID=1649 RepID=A0A433RT42_9BACL|nr:flagellar biosynthetic protein FliR [Kurthia sp. 3B1D]RUS55335.1 flagellar biosynthesis protein FliR [Kurthia sp. 3B1D]